MSSDLHGTYFPAIRLRILAGNERILAMRFELSIFIAAGVLSIMPAAALTPPRSYVQVIVKACPALEQTGQEHKPEAVTGYYADPTTTNAPRPRRSEKPFSPHSIA
jgi:hypothetical protein